MIRQLLRNGQLTLPKEVLLFFNLQPHDLLDIKFDESGIFLRPAPIEEFTDEEYDQLAEKIERLKRKGVKGKTFSSTTEFRSYLDKLMHKK